MKTEIYNDKCENIMAKLIEEGVKIDLIHTDPPYDIKNTKSGSKSKLSKRIQNQQDQLTDLDICGSIDYEEICNMFLQLQDKINIYIWCNKEQILFYLDFYVNRHGCSFDIIKWVKDNPVPAYNNKYMTDTEYCLYFRKGGYCMPRNSVDASTLYKSPINKKDKDMYEHPTIKPLPIVRKLIRNSSKEGGLVADFYMGSGTTGEACKIEGRRFIGVELVEKHYETAKYRISHAYKEMF